MTRAEPTPEEGAVHSGWRDYADGYQLTNVLEAGLDAFVEFGYHGTTVRTIAARAALSVPGLYHHCGSKQDLLATLLARSGEEVLRRTRAAAVEGGNDPRQRFMLIVENIVLYMAHRERLAHLQREIRCLDPAHRPQQIALRDQVEDMLRKAVAEASANGAFMTQDPMGAARAVLLLCRGVADWYSPRGPRTPEQIAQDYVQFALGLVGDRELTHQQYNSSAAGDKHRP